MDENLTDAQQIELIKKLWKEYGIALTAGTLIAISIVVGWNFYKKHTIKQTQHASIIYERMRSDIINNNIEEAKQESEILINKFSRTPYATLSAFTLAKLDVEQKHFDDAVENLQWVIKHNSSKNFRQIARIRLSRIYLAQNKTPDALKILEKVETDSLIGLILEVKGDIYAKLGQSKAAKDAYQEAINKLSNKATFAPLLQMKLDNLSAQ